MSGVGKSFAVVARYIRKLRGGSQPILAQATDGRLYVVKFTNNPQGPNVCFNESVGSELYRACGLAGPPWKPLFISDSFLDQNPDCWMQTAEGSQRPVSGLCFGSRYLSGGGMQLSELIFKTSIRRVSNHRSFWLAWLIDICADQTDNRQAVFLESPKERQLKAFFIDHGHLFGGPKGDLREHFISCGYLDSRLYQSVSSQQLLQFQRVVRNVDVDRVWRSARALPEAWKTPSALDRLSQCLYRLSDRGLLRRIVDSMVDAIERTNGSEHQKRQGRRKLPVRVLCLGVQGGGLERPLTRDRADRAICA